MYNEQSSSNAFYEDITPKELAEQKKFVQCAEAILRSFKMYSPKYDLLDELMRSPPKFTILEPYAENLLQDMSDWFQAGITQRYRPHSIAYMAFIKCLYMRFVEPQKTKFAGRLFDEWQRMELDHCAYFEEISADFSGTLTRCMDVLYYTEVPEEKVNDVKDELRWAMIMSPQKVVYRMLFTAIHRLDTLLASLTICRMLPALFYEKNLKMWHRKETEIDMKEPLLTVVLRRMIHDARSYVKKSSYWDAIEVVAMSLCQRVEGEKEALMDQHSLLNLMLNELSGKNRTPVKSVEIIAKIASRILSLDNPNELVYKFAASMRDQPEPMLFLTPTVFDLIFELLIEHDGKSRDLIVSLKSMLRSIGKRMEHSGTRFDDETRDYIFSKQMPWYVEFAVTRWYSFALDVQTKRVPYAIFHGLDEQEIGYELRAEDVVPVGIHHQEFINDIVDLGLFDVDSALYLLRAKRSIEFHEFNVPDMLDKAVHESYARKTLSEGVENWQVGGFFYEILHRLEVEKKEIDFTSIVKLIPDVISPEEVELVPITEQLKAVTLKALREPLPSPNDWPTEPVKMISAQEIRRQRREQRLRDEELQRKVNARYAQMSEDLRQKWIAEGIIGPNPQQEWWMSHIMKQAAPEHTDETFHEVEEQSEEPAQVHHEPYEPKPITAQERSDLESALLQRRRSRH